MAPGADRGGDRDDLRECLPDEQAVQLVPAFGGAAFQNPIGLHQLPGDAKRWYVVEKGGRILTFQADPTAAVAPTPQVFVDLADRVNATPNEAGLLGLAFDPQFAQTGRVYLSYTAASASSPVDLQSRLSRFVSRDRGLTLDPASEQILIEVDQPFENHNGGDVAFGPDGMLYYALGDGGDAGDPGNRSQNLGMPFGKMMRLDVSGVGATPPPDNPIAAGGGTDGAATGKSAIYALGFRNPWRFSFDTPTNRLWVADVGQEEFEEIDLVVPGGNYGWRVRGGAHCFNPSSGCPTQGLIDPVAEYGRDDGFSITGGFVYRGAAISPLVGQYVFADFVSGKLFALLEAGPGRFDRRLIAQAEVNVAAFGRGNDGELYALDFASGGVFQLAGLPCGDGAGKTFTPEDKDAEGVNPAAPTFGDVYAVLQEACDPCHTKRALGGLAMRTADIAFENLIGQPSTTSACAGRLRVDPGDADSSLLFQKVSERDLCGPAMPLDGPSLDAASIELIRAWIDGGAAR
jgi:glucose/arabinose dehydrogenase